MKPEYKLNDIQEAQLDDMRLIQIARRKCACGNGGAYAGRDGIRKCHKCHKKDNRIENGDMIEYDEIFFCDDCKKETPHRMEARLYPLGHSEVYVCLECHNDAD